MRILHTSDWHLGRTLHGEDLHPHQEAFHDWLVEQVERLQVDVVVISGDVYDRAVPPVAAVKLLGDTLARLAATATVVLTPGNHDSATRLGFGSQLLKAGVHILADMPAIDRPVVVPDEHGDVLFFGLPYLEPDMARHELAGAGEPLARSHEAVTRAAMDRVRAKVTAHTEASGSAPRSVVLAHTFVAGGAGSDSERDLSVGGVDSVPAKVLAGADYMALGHLHGCQDLSASVGAPAWYSGSPLAFSFSERHHRKSVLMVELGAPGTEVEVRRIETPVPRRLTELRGTLAQLLAQRDGHAGDWVKAVVTDPARPAHLQEQLREAFPHLLLTEFAPEGREAREGTPVVRREQNPLEVMDEFLAHVTGAAPTAAEHDVLDRAYSAVRRERE